MTEPDHTDPSAVDPTVAGTTSGADAATGTHAAPGDPGDPGSAADGADTSTGHEPETEQSAEDLAAAADVEEYLHDVIDPELGINVVDLGLVYGVRIDHSEGVKTAVIDMTLTSPACPLTDMIEDQAAVAVVNNGAADEVRVNWVWVPPWGPHMFTEEGREQLRALGFAV